MAALTNEQARLFSEPNFAVVATIGGEGVPQQSVVWVDWDGEHVVFNTTAARAKSRHLDRDPRVSVLVIDREDPYRWVAVEGTAELEPEPGIEHIDSLARKYRDEGWGPPRPGEQRVIVRLRPDQVSTYGFES
ncbi:MAG: hypothetical protein QOE36_1205 [Gaiellaceae bacterium]|nr:hypothetical protein [Gaiellaceae bacterium]